jgi:hypothetical protein
VVDGFKVSAEKANSAKEYWDEHALPDLRDPSPGDRCYYVGWSIRQEQYVLLSEDVDTDDYYDYACDAYVDLGHLIPTTFVTDGEVVGEINYGFWDIYGNETTELTFSDIWLATLLQLALDDDKNGICLRMTSGFYLAEKIESHIQRTGIKITAKGRFASWQAMPIRNEAREYVHQYFEKMGQLPFGRHTLPSGIDVTFPDSDEAVLVEREQGNE